MSKPIIHPTAIISPSAFIDDGTRVGPFCVIDENVRIGSGTRVGPHTDLHAGVSIGQDNFIGGHVILEKNVKIGSENQIEAKTHLRNVEIGNKNIIKECSIGASPQFSKVEADYGLESVVLGDENIIGEYVTINAGSKGKPTRLGNKNTLLSYVHLGHGCSLGNYTVLVNAVQLGGNVFIDDFANLAAGVNVAPFMRIGRYAFVAANAEVKKDVPPYCAIAKKDNELVVYFLNKVMADRTKLPPEKRKNIQTFYNHLFKDSNGLNKHLILEKAEQLQEELATDEAKEIADFIKLAVKERSGIYLSPWGHLHFYNPASSSNKPGQYHSVKEAAQTKPKEQ